MASDSGVALRLEVVEGGEYIRVRRAGGIVVIEEVLLRRPVWLGRGGPKAVRNAEGRYVRERPLLKP